MAVGATFAHELRPGDRYTPLTFAVSAELNQQFLYALEDFDPSYLGDRALVHPVLLLHMSARTRSPSFRLAANTGSVFARDKVTFRSAARVGELLTVDWLIRDVYERKGRLYQAMAITVSGADSRKIEREMHSVFFTKDGSPLALPGHGA